MRMQSTFFAPCRPKTRGWERLVAQRRFRAVFTVRVRKFSANQSLGTRDPNLADVEAHVLGWRLSRDVLRSWQQPHSA